MEALDAWFSAACIQHDLNDSAMDCHNGRGHSIKFGEGVHPYKLGLDLELPQVHIKHMETLGSKADPANNDYGYMWQAILV